MVLHECIALGGCIDFGYHGYRVEHGLDTGYSG